MERIVKCRIAMQSWKTPAAVVALAFVVVALGARAWNCASATSCHTMTEVAICSPASSDSPSCARAVEAVKESSPRLEPGLDAGLVSVVDARENVSRQIGTIHARVAQPPPTAADRLALLSVLLI